jgi:hypothetical protein
MIDPLSAACPKCGAGVGERCDIASRDQGGALTYRKPHAARIKAANVEDLRVKELADIFWNAQVGFKSADCGIRAVLTCLKDIGML